jgi:NitT/TauT family transport system substrate-binding protein
MPNGLANQVIDAAYVPEPAASTAVERGAAVPIITDLLRGAQVTVLIAGPTFLRERATVEAFMRAYLRGLRDLNAEGWNAPAVAESVERYTRVPAATIQKILPEYADPEARVNWDSIMDQQRFYLERGYLNYGEPLDILRFAEDGPRQAAIRALSR